MIGETDTIRRVRVAWTRSCSRPRRDMATHPWQWEWTDPEGYPRHYDTKAEATRAMAAHTPRSRPMTATDSAVRVIAVATGVGDPALLIFENAVDYPDTDDEYVSWATEPSARHPLTLDPETGECVEDLDAVLAGMGYRRVGPWDWEFDDSASAIVEELP